VHTEPAPPLYAAAAPRPSQPRVPASPHAPYAPQNNYGYEIPQQFNARPQIDMTPARVTVEPQGDNFTTQMTQVLRETFGLEPKGRGRIYQKPYPAEYDQIPFPRNYCVPDFAKFNGEDGKATLEHVGQFTLQCGEASSNDMLKLRMFPLSLSGTAFTWFSSLASNSIFSFAQLEQKFHEYFYSGDRE